MVGVRGTLFWGLCDLDLNSTFACFESTVVVQAQGVEIQLQPGQRVQIPFNSPPGPVEAANVPLSYLDTFKVGDSLQGLDDLLK